MFPGNTKEQKTKVEKKRTENTNGKGENIAWIPATGRIAGNSKRATRVKGKQLETGKGTVLLRPKQIGKAI